MGLEMLEDEELGEEWMEEYKDEGYIELLLKVLAQMCDGQFGGLQVSGSMKRLHKTAPHGLSPDV